ncbi:MAG: hypothetical protein WC876_03860 [Candidatus Thermoplasmatota archaeon]|jgi:hypothetical protein
MDVVEDLLELDWEGPLAAVADFPAMLLYGAALTFAVAKGPAVLEAIRAALEPLFGSAQERKTFLGGRRLEWSGRMNAEASVRGAQATVRFGQRVKGKRVEEAVRRLAEVPEARHLRLQAGVRRFGRAPDSPQLDG